jgi:cobalt-zinc-cadmium efflux system outer membrane protein
MRIRSVLLAASAVLLPALAGAQAPLSLQAALDEALAGNPDLIALRAQLDADRRRPDQARVLMPPMLEAQIWQWPLNTINPAGATYMFMAEQELPGRGKRDVRVRLSLADVAATEAAIPVRARDIVNGIARTYAELFVARKSVEVARETIDLLRQIADGTQVRYASGKGAQQDVLKAVLEISRLHEEQVMLNERVRMAEARLNALLGRDAASPVGALAQPREDVALPAVDALQRLALERQPELAMAKREIDRAEAAVAVARSDRKPDFLVRGGYMLMPGDAGAFTASFGISWPNAPWSRKRVDLAIEQAELNVTAAHARYDAAVNGLRLMVQEAYVRLESASERAALIRTSITPQSTQALDLSRVGYQSDRGGFLDMIDNQRLVAEARLGYYRALADIELARADLERAIGAPLGTPSEIGDAIRDQQKSVGGAFRPVGSRDR